jgi:3-hydroxybutyryl-CoA dehydrogenase
MPQKKLFVWGDELRKQDILSRKMPAEFRLEFAGTDQLIPDSSAAAGYFILDEALIQGFPFHKLDYEKPVFICSVLETLQELPAGYPLIRLNAWPGFLRNPLLELSGHETDRANAEKLLHELDWGFEWVADVPGLVTPRVISMIINEACFASEEKVSTPDEIDIALQLGTSYPRGPFAWSQQIGPDRIIRLLNKLASQDGLYQPAAEIETTLIKTR